jgi:hypothetical protein
MRDDWLDLAKPLQRGFDCLNVSLAVLAGICRIACQDGDIDGVCFD